MNLFACEYELWKRIRPMISPAFTSEKMEKMYPLINECTKFLLNNLESHVNNGKEVIVKDVFGCLTMDVIAKCAFGTDINANEDKDNPFVVQAKRIFDVNIFHILLLNLFPTFILQNLKALYQDFNESSKFFYNMSRHIIKCRRRKNIRREDFLQLLIDCQDAERVNVKNHLQQNYSDAEAHHIGGNQEFNGYEKLSAEKPLDNDEAIAQAVIFFMIGFETMTTTLSFCSYELALNQDVQDKLCEEIKKIEEEKGSIDYETLSKLPYLDAVISETLRKYPPVTRLNRVAAQKHQLGNTGITINKGSVVNILVYAIHHNEEYYPEPEQFKPERFLPENRDLIEPYTYLPFGIGPRNCIGMRFGLLETKLALAKIITKYKFVRSKNTQVPLEFLANRGVLTAKSIIIGVERR